jgi:hypothetical protein
MVAPALGARCPGGASSPLYCDHRAESSSVQLGIEMARRHLTGIRGIVRTLGSMGVARLAAAARKLPLTWANSGAGWT